jgi:hypothetical protein
MTSEVTAVKRADSWVTARMLALLLVALPVLVNAIALAPEVRYGAPSDNDQIFHYLFVERANQAVAAGDNPVDHWLPELELGFPQFHYYQNLPHLTVVALYHLLLERVSLLTTLNLVRYLLMVLFPLTVYWSMRRMEFSMVAAAVAAAFGSTLSSRVAYGFDFHSYIWGGLGMFPQLCSMHLMFIGIACLYRVLERNTGLVAAIVAASAMVLSDLLYGYIFALAALILWLWCVVKQAFRAKGAADAFGRVWRTTAKMAIVAFAAAVITAYQSVPFFLQIRYLNRTYPDIPRESARLPVIASGLLASLLGGSSFDDHRLPVVTALVLLGVVYAVVTFSDRAQMALAFLGAFLFLMLAPFAFGNLVFIIPLWRLVPLARLISGRDFAAIILAGLGGDFIWQWWPAHRSQIRAAAAAGLLLALCVIALAERWGAYQASARGMEATAEAIQDDPDLPQIMSALRAAPPGRVYAGTRGNWGSWMTFERVFFYDLLPIAQFDTVMPWQTLSLNALYLWNLNLPNLKLCRLFNIRHVVAPSTVSVPSFYRPVVTASRYNLYEIDSGGYIQLGTLAKIIPMPHDRKFYATNNDWIVSDAPARGQFIAYLSAHDPVRDTLKAVLNPDATGQDSPPLGSIEDEIVTPDSMSARATATTAAVLVIKTSYHPNWHVFVDGHEQSAFMVSPSYIGTLLTPGQHQIRAEYRSSLLKKLLMVLSCLTLVSIIGARAFGSERRIFPTTSNS